MTQLIPILFYTSPLFVGIVAGEATLFVPCVADQDGDATLFVTRVAGGAGSLIGKSIILGPTALPSIFSSICLMGH